MTGFQKQVNTAQAPGQEGDFCSHNPRWNVNAGPGGLIAGPAGLTVARFAWFAQPLDQDGTPIVAQNFGQGIPAGFVHREQQALITKYLDETSLMVPSGFGVTLFNGGDFWVKNRGAGEALVGMKAYANLNDGTIGFALPGTNFAGASATGSIAASTLSVTGSITNNILTVSAVGSGVVVPGATITGGGTATGTKVVSQISGTPGGVGAYYVSTPEQTVASGTITGTYGTFTAASGLSGGAFAVGQPLTGTNVVAGTTITAFGTGTGGLGTYIVDNNTVVASTAISVLSTSIETKWIAASTGLNGELVKMTSHTFG